MGCCGMRSRQPRYVVLNSKGSEIKRVDVESTARKLAMSIGGTYREVWVDGKA
jgi:hypothetical protein